jgi:hypothetical protein
MYLPLLSRQAMRKNYFDGSGRRDAFSLMAGRCSAADVQCLKRIRDNKLYRGFAKDWEEFCDKYLHMSRSNTNRMILLQDEFGDEYFYITQATRVSLKDYRAYVAPAVRDGAIECNGEAIPLIPENSDRLAVAVATLCAAAPAPEKEEPKEKDDVAALIAATDAVIAQFRSMRQRHGKPDRRMTTAVGMLWERFAALLLEMS